MNKLFLYTDGGSRLNPGPAAAAFVIKTENGQLLKKNGKFLGRATNNEAEYEALIEGLRASLPFNPETLVCFSDSALVVNQLNGRFKVKEARLRDLVLKVKILEQKFRSIRYEHIAREQNGEADELVKKILDGRKV